MKNWLLKTEPVVFSFADLQKKGILGEKWDGVRNYQARNFMRDEMRIGDKVIFYHSNANPSGIAGLAEIIKTAEPDESAWDKNSLYFDPSSQRDNPRWWAVTVGKPLSIPRFLPLDELKNYHELKGMLLLQKGQRLSVQPVSQEHYDFILQICQKK